MAKWKYMLEEGPQKLHTFNSGFIYHQTAVLKRTLVPTIRAHAIDPTAGRYAVIDGKLRRRVETQPKASDVSPATMGSTLLNVLAQMAPYALMQGINDGLRNAKVAA